MQMVIKSVVSKYKMYTYLKFNLPKNPADRCTSGRIQTQFHLNKILQLFNNPCLD